MEPNLWTHAELPDHWPCLTTLVIALLHRVYLPWRELFRPDVHHGLAVSGDPHGAQHGDVHDGLAVSDGTHRWAR